MLFHLLTNITVYQAQKDAAKEALFAANIGVGGDVLGLLSEDNPDGVVMITEDGKITFTNKASLLSKALCAANCCHRYITCSVLYAESPEHVWLLQARNGGQECQHAHAAPIQNAASCLLT